MSQKNDEYDDDNDNTRFYYAFTLNILNIEKSIRWVGITGLKWYYYK